MDETSVMQTAERARERDRNSEEFRYFQRSPKQPIEGLAAGVLEHQRHAVIVAGECHRPRRPGNIKFGLQLIFVFEPLERPGRDVFRRDNQDWRHAVARAPVAGEVTLPQRGQHIARKLHRAGLLPRLTGVNISAFQASGQTARTRSKQTAAADQAQLWVRALDGLQN